ncbi:SOS response-associated peptidase [Mesobacillus subterraneus]|uniref:Abasic site processing protein n=1 Tax=Mesobacillus subterraneus TaxID=285983 RepID=A0A0D6ZC69_9BACI|nr:SOS response-associated peptidase [Mesobacillus subterraneus]KIY22651.1 hypothetical protein UB32_07470 [Mesobacillus subterraneus]
MCGRFSLFEDISSLEDQFKFDFRDEIEMRYNIAPGQEILAVIDNDEGRIGKKMRWGLIPFWADDEKIGYRMINARAETVDEKASFKDALKQRRCLILTDGFYEWKKEGKHKQPYRFAMKDKKPFAFAGVWENWNKDGKDIASCTIITTSANEIVGKIHDRMPVILPKEKFEVWLDRSLNQASDLKKLLVPYEGSFMEVYPVSTAINSAKNEGKELIVPLNSL